jgi:3-oxosteroid 1-dehydrogenase
MEGQQMSGQQTGSWDQTVDLLVVGSGAGALAAAVVGRDRGGEVLVIEKTDRYGGSSAMSSCVMWIPNNHLMGPAGVEDNEEDAWSYLKGTTAGAVPDDRLRAFLDHGPEMVRYLCDRTRVRISALPLYPDYYPAVAGSRPGGRSLEPDHFDARQLGDDFLNMRDQNRQMQIMGRIAMTAVEARAMLCRAPGWIGLFARLTAGYLLDIPWRFKSTRDRNTAMGNALIGMLRLSLRDRKVPLWLNAPARELIVEEGRVAGVAVERHGRVMRIRAEKGVILGAGGFEGNQAMREKYLPSPTRAEWTCGNPHNTGDLIEMGQSVGAAVDLMDDAWWGPVTVPPGETPARMLVIEKSLPGSILVNQRGERFINEALPYIDVVNEMYRRHTPESPCVPAYLVFDAEFRRKYPCGPMLQGSQQPDWMLASALKQGYLKKADTLEGLAAQLGVNAAGLAATVEKLNADAEVGIDQEFHRGETVFEKYYGDELVQPNPCLAPIQKPPFYGLDALPGELGTKGGLVVDARARVLVQSGEVIPGLYAIGNCSSSVMGRSYPGAGATIGPAMAFGYIAACDAIS